MRIGCGTSRGFGGELFAEAEDGLVEGTVPGGLVEGTVPGEISGGERDVIYMRNDLKNCLD